jgi:hypothetical protein
MRVEESGCALTHQVGLQAYIVDPAAQPPPPLVPLSGPTDVRPQVGMSVGPAGWARTGSADAAG